MNLSVCKKGPRLYNYTEYLLTENLIITILISAEFHGKVTSLSRENGERKRGRGSQSLLRSTAPNRREYGHHTRDWCDKKEGPMRFTKYLDIVIFQRT